MKGKGKFLAVVLSLLMIVTMGALTACGGDKNVAVTGITLPEKETVEVGSDVTLTPTFAPENATNKKVTWESDTEDVATVDATGKVTGVKIGNAIITATSEDGEFEASCFIEVVMPIGAKLLTLTIDGGANDGVAMTFYAKGVVEISAFQADIGIAVLPAEKFRTEWTVTDGLVEVQPGSANVSFAGQTLAYPMHFAFTEDDTVLELRTFLEDGSEPTLGQFAITATQYDSLVAGYIEADFAVEGVTLNKTTISLYETQQEILIATITPDYASNKTITWTSSKDAVATVESGIITAVSTGSATITATAVGGFTATCAVTVTEKVAVTSITIPETLALAFGKNGVGQKGSAAATAVAPENASNKAVAYTSSDKTVATVNASTGEVTALKVGTTTITATSADNTAASDTCAVTVTEVPLVKYSTSGISSMIFTADGKVTVSAMAMEGSTIIYNATAKTTWTNSDNLAITNVSTTGTMVDYMGSNVIKINLAPEKPEDAMALLKGTVKFAVSAGTDGAKNVKVTFEHAQPETGAKPADIEFVTFTLTSAELAKLTTQA